MKGNISKSFLLFALVAGCAHHDAETIVMNPYAPNMTFAVAPVLNFSGEGHFDSLRATDLLASELTYVNGVNVLPVSRVAAYLAAQGKTQIESAAHALAVADAVGADAIWVAGITEYDPYTPVVGLAIQVYVVPHAATSGLDPFLAERLAQPMSIKTLTDASLPRDQIQMVYNGTHANVADAVKRFAGPRKENDSPLGWREYLKVQTLFLRFCWHDAIARISTQERWTDAAPTPDKTTEQPI
ncbi:MAG TPA: hypothetical protein VMV81_03310 [Phycisphaerae bacterium]|nr:hypothetical protein [Phycisphaerae bacterium]